jgi:hypothetical protein
MQKIIFLYLLLFINLIIMLLAIYKIYNNKFVSNSRKKFLYLISIFIPILGLYLVTKKS